SRGFARSLSSVPSEESPSFAKPQRWRADENDPRRRLGSIRPLRARHSPESGGSREEMASTFVANGVDCGGASVAEGVDRIESSRTSDQKHARRPFAVLYRADVDEIGASSPP